MASTFRSTSGVKRILELLGRAYQREALFFGTAGLSGFYLLALASFSPLDPSLFSTAFPPSTTANLTGIVGAYVSGLAIFLLGAIAWLLPLPFISTSILILLDRPKVFAVVRIFGWLITLGCAAAIIALKQPRWSWGGFDLPSGGVIGNWVSSQLTLWLGPNGSWIIVGTGLICAIIWILQMSVLTVSINVTSKGLGLSLAWMIATWQWCKKIWTQSLGNRKHLLDPINALSEGEAPAPEPGRSLKEHFSEECADKTHQILPIPPKPVRRSLNPFKKHGTYTPPSLAIFETTKGIDANLNVKELEMTAALLVQTFEEFGISGKIVGYQPGPVVTVFEYQPDAGVKQSKVLGLIDDIALTLKVDSIFIHPVRGKRALGIQVPNALRQKVHLGDIISSAEFNDSDSPLTFGMGKSLNGTPICSNLATMPHLLAAGATGSGKSVAINALLCSIIMKASPDEVKMILVDPKMLELSVYEGIPHLLMPVITDAQRASLALKWAALEMERRYKLMQLAKVRNISGFNGFWDKASESDKEALRATVGQDIDQLPFIMLVIDELADLMMTAPKDVEASIQRLAQKARASGIHMVLATQRPSVDIITGVIKANLPCRVAFQVVSKHDSRTILDVIGAEKLLGKGDMLLQRPGAGRLERIQGALISDEEVLNLVAAAKDHVKVNYNSSIITWIDDELARQRDTTADAETPTLDDDPKFDEAITIAQSHGVVSASFLQRHLKIGYNRAARIVESMEAQGLVAQADGAKPRKWLGARPDVS